VAEYLPAASFDPVPRATPEHRSPVPNTRGGACNTDMPGHMLKKLKKTNYKN